MALYFTKAHEVLTCLLNMTVGDVEDSVSISYYGSDSKLMGYNGPLNDIKTPNIVKILEGRSYTMCGTVLNKKTLIKYNYEVTNNYTSDRGSYRLVINVDTATFVDNLINDIIERRQEFTNIPQNTLATYYRAVLKARAAIKYKPTNSKYDNLNSIYCNLKYSKHARPDIEGNDYIDIILELQKDYPELEPDFNERNSSVNSVLLNIAINGFALTTYGLYKDIVGRVGKQSKIIHRFMNATNTLTDDQIAKLDEFDLMITRASTEIPKRLTCSRNVGVSDVVRIHNLSARATNMLTIFRKKRKELEARING